MKLRRLVCISAVTIILAAICRAEVNDDLFFEAIRLKENGLFGKAGEQGPLQILPVVAREVGGSPWDEATARRHLARLRTYLSTHGYPQNVYCLALAWTAGGHGATSGHASAAKRRYARDVCNLYADLVRRSPRHD